MWGIQKQSKSIQDLFRQEKQEWIEGARVVARKLLRKYETITIEDVLAVYPRPSYLHYNITGMVFNHPDFKGLNFVRSKRPLSHGNLIRRWRLREEREYAQ